MTSISQQAVLPSQVSSSITQAAAQVQSPPSSIGGTTSPQAAVPAAASGRSYANATKKLTTSNSAIASTTSASSHGKTDSISPGNGKPVIPPAVPTLGMPTIVNGNNAGSTSSGPGEHNRKASVTINSQGASGHMPNGGPAAGKPTAGNGIQFGSMNTSTSPAIVHSAPLVATSSSSLAVSAPTNPRVTSPATSPSPIPQPPASGGRPPPGRQAQGNGLSFGSMGGEDPSRQLRPGIPSGSLTPGMQPAHLRRESSQSSHGDMGNPNMGPNAGRGGYPTQAGRGRAYGPQYPQQLPYSPNASYRAVPNQPRAGPNMGQQYQPQSQPLRSPYPHSPHLAARSPALASSQPIHPQPGQMPMPSPQIQYAPYGAYPQQMGPPQNQYPIPQGYDPNYAFYNHYMQPGIPFPAPVSPRPPHFLPSNTPSPYVPGQYAPHQQPTSMSRTPSAVSDRPNSVANPPQTPMTPAVSHQATTTRSTNSPAPKTTNFIIPTRRSAGIQIKDPDSGAIKTFDKQPASPAPPSKSPATVSSAQTPPPQTPSHTDSHQRTESKTAKTDEEKKTEMRDAIARKIEADKEEERLRKEAAEAKALKEKEEAEAKLLEEQKMQEAKEAEEAKVKEEAEAAAKTEQANKDLAAAKAVEEDEEAERARKEREEEEYYARLGEEEERKEREAEEAYQKKKAAAKAEEARKEAEAMAMADEDMKRAEREAEAAEEARLKKLEETEGEDKTERVDLFAALKKSESTSQTAVSPAAETPAESGAATPVSDASSMGPPPRAVIAGKKVPAALKIETTKPVEAPQPSAALQSLRSARFLTAINDVTYPPAIASPNPALNTAAPMGKFRYDKNFLMQFQTVFVEKPSETWSEKVKETVGDISETPASARGSARTGNMMTSRQASNRGTVLPGTGFGGGAFGGFTNAGGRTLPPGTTSESRFQASSQPGQRPATQNPAVRYNPNIVGGFPISLPPMSRTGSSNSPAHNQSSPRNPSQRGPGGRGSNRGKPARENDQDAKKMPLTANADVKPIQISATGWKPRSIVTNAAGMAGPPPGGDGYLAPDVVQRKVKAALNKMTPSTFDKISGQILDIVAQSKQETDGRTLRQVIQLTFEKATDEAHWAQMYAEFCSRMLQNMSPEIRDETLPLDKNGKVNAGGTLFRKYLLNRCQQDFEAGWKDKLPDKPEGELDQAAMLSDEYYIAAAAKRRGLGLVRFIGELFKLGMLTSRIMHMCVKRLVDWEGMPDEAEVESLTSLLKTIGENLDSEEKMRTTMDAYFDRINNMIKAEGLPSRLRFMLMDIVDLRKKGWKTKDSATKGPTTLEEVRQQSAAAEREKEAQRAADSSRRGGGGGRMGLGRGDARNFSGGGQNMPPPDYQKNTVGMDDLRRLGNRAGSRQASSQGAPSFGPTSMFSARGSNTRRNLGPGGGLVRGGEESGASSRTTTPPAQRDKKDRDEKEAATHANAFSALAGLDSGETPDHPGSPPSTASSPPIVAARTSNERQRSKSPLGQTKDTEIPGEGG